MLALALIATPAAYWRHQRLTLEIRLAETHSPPEAPQAGPMARAAALSASTARTTQRQRRLAIANQRYIHLFGCYRHCCRRSCGLLRLNSAATGFQRLQRGLSAGGDPATPGNGVASGWRRALYRCS